MPIRQVNGDTALASAARGTGTFVSGPLNAPGAATHCVLHIHCTAASGTAPTLNVSLEESADNATWTAITGSSTTQLAAAGNATANALVAKNYVRVTATVAGTTPSFTFAASVLVFSD